MDSTNLPDFENSLPYISKDMSSEQRIHQRLCYLYNTETATSLQKRINRLLLTHRQLMSQPRIGTDWSERDVVLISYADSIHSPITNPLQTLTAFLDKHLANAFSMVHLLPFFPYSSDDGFSVTDFRAVKGDVGSWGDIQQLSKKYQLAFDLVLNHCSRENLWFIDYLFDEKPACDYFIDIDPATNLSMVTRPRSSPLLSGVRTQRGMRHVWTTFSNDQIDMNYANPDVLLEFIDILLYYIRRGARMVRLDAVAYLWKTIGTNCIHLPQTHQVVKLFRDILQMVEPNVLILTETNVPHTENISYFGDGDEAHLVYQFSLPPLLLHAIYAGTTHYLLEWLQQLQLTPLPNGCTYLNFTASHDGVGLRPLEGLIPEQERDDMLQSMRQRGGFISTRKQSDGRESPYELNISYFDAYRDHTGNDNWQIERFLLSQIVALSLQGIPAVYLHSLTATANDHEGVERSGHTRSINRRKWDSAELERLLKNYQSDNSKVFHCYRDILALRRNQPAFHPNAEQQLVLDDERLLVLKRNAIDNSQQIIVVANFTAKSVTIESQKIAVDLCNYEELLRLQPPVFKQEQLSIPAYAIFWFSKRQPQ